MNVSRPNYFQGGRGKRKSKKDDVNFFQVVREGRKKLDKGSRYSTEGEPSYLFDNKRERAESLFTSRMVSSDENTNFNHSLFTRQSSSGPETSHMRASGPSVFEILSSPSVNMFENSRDRASTSRQRDMSEFHSERSSDFFLALPHERDATDEPIWDEEAQRNMFMGDEQGQNNFYVLSTPSPPLCHVQAPTYNDHDNVMQKRVRKESGFDNVMLDIVGESPLRKQLRSMGVAGTSTRNPSGNENTELRQESVFKTPLPSSKSSSSLLKKKRGELFSTSSSRYSNLPSATDSFLSPSVGSTPRSTSTENDPTSSYLSTKVPSTPKTPITESDSYFIVALTEGRGISVGEVGLACVDIKHPRVTLCQISDTQTYMRTLTKINIFNAAELLIPDTFLLPQYSSNLFKMVTNKFLDMKVVTVKRVFFNDQNGFEAIKELILPELSSLQITIRNKYYALAAMSALIKYIEFEHSVNLPRKSILIEYECAKGVAYIDIETVRRMELVSGNSRGLAGGKYCLYSVINKCKTIGGKRRLRTMLLQPPCKRSTIMKQQEKVDFLVHDPILLGSLQAILLKFVDVEKLLWLCKKPPNFKNENKTCENLTNFVLLLKKTIEETTSLKDILGDAQQEYFIKVRQNLTDDRLDIMKGLISEVINDDARPAKGYSASEMQRCFSIKEKINDLLDVARLTYSNLINLVQEEVDKLSEMHSLPLKMAQTSDRGFHVMMSTPKNRPVQEDNLPQQFIQVRFKGNSLRFTTKEIYCLNLRILRVLQDIQMFSNVILYDLVLKLRNYVGCLYKLCEDLADLDVLCSLAQISALPTFTKPTFSEILSLKGARHPVLDMTEPKKPIPNDIYASKTKNLSIITGPNMSGKSIYLSMIPLLQIMAQIGSYVPADSAVFRITDHIAVRKGDIDSLEQGLSSFAYEVKEFVYIQQVMTRKSLIIADEVFQGTSTDEGTSLAWAYLEDFSSMSSYTFVSTHFIYLTNLENIFRNVSNYHLEAIERDESSYSRLTFTYRVLPGPTKVNYYGLRILRNANLPKKLKKGAFDVADDIRRIMAASVRPVNPIPPDRLIQFKKIDKLEAFMKNLYDLSFTDSFTLEMIEGLQRMAIEEILSPDEEDKGETNKDKNPERNIQENAQTQETTEKNQPENSPCRDGEIFQNTERNICEEDLNNSKDQSSQFIQNPSTAFYNSDLIPEVLSNENLNKTDQVQEDDRSLNLTHLRETTNENIYLTVKNVPEQSAQLNNPHFKMLNPSGSGDASVGVKINFSDECVPRRQNFLCTPISGQKRRESTRDRFFQSEPLKCTKMKSSTGQEKSQLFGGHMSQIERLPDSDGEELSQGVIEKRPMHSHPADRVIHYQKQRPRAQTPFKINQSKCKRVYILNDRETAEDIGNINLLQDLPGELGPEMLTSKEESHGIDNP